ncbi:TPA: hypothetical protein PKT84_002567 [Acinetobacter baumannii]|nr:hypothetical protein [Acinetobacter baumannii]HDI2492026.1 hypothetical protein [Acinetobacter baumannii]HDI2512160.1 hypothetical protein [Acinetobacter baumannii]HDI2809689.1 hypothetical protein [Acinetobacter baumannii]HDI2812407.1 hypothetical protein [Acinetobacter baumannii]
MIIAESIFSRIGNLRKVMSDPQMNAHYSEGTARAQAGQMLQMFPLLKIATKEGNKLIPNEQSLILAKMKADLFPSEK